MDSPRLGSFASRDPYAKIAFSVMVRQCLKRRIPDQATLSRRTPSSVAFILT
jgi:hypothetical protein